MSLVILHEEHFKSTIKSNCILFNIVFTLENLSLRDLTRFDSKKSAQLQ